MPSEMRSLIHLQTLFAFAVGLEKGCKTKELGLLKNLKGTPTLANLGNVQSKEETMTATLVEKKSLRHLTFWWFPRGKNDNLE